MIAADAMYRLAVLTAIQNIADPLHALETDAEALNAASLAARGRAVGLHCVVSVKIR